MALRSSTTLASLGSLLAFIPMFACSPQAPSQKSVLAQREQATGAWEVTKQWDAAEESEFSAFVMHIGRARAAGKCATLASCLANPEANPLFSEEDATRNLFADCADLPHILRAYFAYKNALPFQFVWNIEKLPAPAHVLSPPVRPTGIRSHLNYSSFERLVSGIVNTVYTDMYRTPAKTEGTDTYPLALSREAIKPGTVYHDPNGHILLVYEVTDDGRILAIDGHPDNSLTVQTLGKQYAMGTEEFGGGFRGWRPFKEVTQGDTVSLVSESNADLPDFDGVTQYAGRFDWNGESLGLWDYLRFALANSDTKLDPVREVDREIDTLCASNKDRMLAVNASLDRRLHLQTHPGLPQDLFSTTGDWEAFSTPGRDTRYRKQFKLLAEQMDALVRRYDDSPENFDFQGTTADLVSRFSQSWTVRGNSDECGIQFPQSDGEYRFLSLVNVNERATKLSFDPYHCAEWRWGEYDSPAGQNPTCLQDPQKPAFYEQLKAYRWATERDSTTGQSILPEREPELSLGKALASLKAEFPAVDPTPGPTPTPTPEPTPSPSPVPTPAPLDLTEELIAFGGAAYPSSYTVRTQRTYATSEWIHIRGQLPADPRVAMKRSVRLSMNGTEVEYAGVNLISSSFHAMFKLPVGQNQVLVLQVRDDTGAVLTQTELALNVVAD
jgi:hypothetical protein